MNCRSAQNTASYLSNIRKCMTSIPIHSRVTSSPALQMWLRSHRLIGIVYEVETEQTQLE